MQILVMLVSVDMAEEFLVLSNYHHLSNGYMIVKDLN